MNQRAITMWLLLIVCLMFGGMLVFDLKQKKEQDNPVKNESILSDNWGTPNNPNNPIINDQQQIIASSYRESIKRSGEEGIPVLIFFDADWCSWCKKMKSETLTDRNVKEIMKNYVLVFVDYDRNKSVARKFGVQGLPSYAITNVNETKLKSDGGYLSADKFHRWLDKPSVYKQQKQPKLGKRDVTPPPQNKPRQQRPRWRG